MFPGGSMIADLAFIRFNILMHVFVLFEFRFITKYLWAVTAFCDKIFRDSVLRQQFRGNRRRYLL